ncbi:hypothetical protein CCMA1212_008550 [Trichoderma ghanense]|uniref:Uncharacterized protein n=1 Tax=Trichoderma ghanense TaxID=65468 RepID=A0ABY2GWH1_9HYPO
MPSSTSIVVLREYQQSTSVPEMWQPVGELEKVVSHTKTRGPGEEILTLTHRPFRSGPQFRWTRRHSATGCGHGPIGRWKGCVRAELLRDYLGGPLKGLGPRYANSCCYRFIHGQTCIMRTHADAEPGNSYAMDAPHVTTRGCMSCLPRTAWCFRVCLHSCWRRSRKGGHASGAKSARMDMKHSMRNTTNFDMQKDTRRDDKGSAERARTGTEQRRSVAERVSPHPASETCGCGVRFREGPAKHQRFSQPTRMANQLLVWGSSGAAPPVVWAGQREDEWLDTAFQVAMQLCEAMRAEASSRSSSSCQTADSRRRRGGCCGQPATEGQGEDRDLPTMALLLHFVTAAM